MFSTLLGKEGFHHIEDLGLLPTRQLADGLDTLAEATAGSVQASPWLGFAEQFGGSCPENPRQIRQPFRQDRNGIALPCRVSSLGKLQPLRDFGLREACGFAPFEEALAELGALAGGWSSNWHVPTITRNRSRA